MDTVDNDVEESISSSKTSDKTSLLASFGYDGKRKDATAALISATSKAIEENYFIFPLLKGNPEEKQKVGKLWMKLDNTNNDDLKQLWIHRWISLFIFNKLSKKDAFKNGKHKNAITQLMKYSSNLVPSYLKSLRYENLEETDLSYANLFRADLYGAHLSGANLFRADLIGADLSYANLFRADLTDINMSGANLFRADLSSSVLYRANLVDSNFSYANLSDAKLSLAILSYANLSNSNISRTNLSYANLSDANLCQSSIEDADLSYANLSDANVSCALIKGRQKHDNLVCPDADFNGASISDVILFEYLKAKAKTFEQTPNLKIINTDVADTCSYITTTFSNRIDGDSINSNSFALYDNGTPVPGTVSLISPENKTAVFIPLHPLRPGTEYTLEISKEVRDSFHNGMESDTKLQTAKTAVFDRVAILGIKAKGDDGNTPRNTVDTDLNTRWTNDGIGSWIQLDLGEPKNISNLQIAWFKGNRRMYNFEITPFNKIQGSEDVDGIVKNFPGLHSKGNSLLPEKYEIGNVGRYIRITVNGNSQNNWASITEIIVLDNHNNIETGPQNRNSR